MRWRQKCSKIQVKTEINHNFGALRQYEKNRLEDRPEDDPGAPLE
jgi:hypothetical protein